MAKQRPRNPLDDLPDANPLDELPDQEDAAEEGPSPKFGRNDFRKFISPIPALSATGQYLANKIEGVDRGQKPVAPVEIPGTKHGPGLLETAKNLITFPYTAVKEAASVYPDVIKLLHDADPSVVAATIRGGAAGVVEGLGNWTPLDILTQGGIVKGLHGAKAAGVKGLEFGKGAIGKATLKAMAEDARLARAAKVPEVVIKSPTGEVKSRIKSAPIEVPTVKDTAGNVVPIDMDAEARADTLRNARNRGQDFIREGEGVLGSSSLDPVAQIAGETSDKAPPMTLMQGFERMIDERKRGWNKVSLPPTAEEDLPPLVQETRGMNIAPTYKPGEAGNIYAHSTPTSGRPELGMVREEPTFQITLSDGTVIDRADLKRRVMDKFNKGQITEAEAVNILQDRSGVGWEAAERRAAMKAGRPVPQGTYPKTGVRSAITPQVIPDVVGDNVAKANALSRMEPESIAPRVEGAERLAAEMEANNLGAAPGAMDALMAETLPGPSTKGFSLKDAANADLAEGYDDIIKALRGNKMSGIPLDPQLLVGMSKIVKGLVKRGYHEVNMAWRELESLLGPQAAAARAAFDEVWKTERASMPALPTTQKVAAGASTLGKMPALPGSRAAKAEGPKGAHVPTPAEAARLSPEGQAKIAKERAATQARLAAAKGDAAVANSPAVRQEVADIVTRPTERFDISGTRVVEGTIFDTLSAGEQFAAKKLQNQIPVAARASIHAGETPSMRGLGDMIRNKITQYQALYERAKAAGEAPSTPDTPAIATAERADVGDRVLDVGDEGVASRLNEDNLQLRAKQELQLGQLKGELANEWRIRKARLKKLAEDQPVGEDRTLQGQLKGTTRLTGSGHRVFDPSVADAPGETVATGRPSRAKASRPSGPVVINDPFAEQMAAGRRRVDPGGGDNELLTSGEEGLRAKNVSPANEPIRDIETEADRSASASDREYLREEKMRKAGFTDEEMIQIEMGEIPDRVMDGSMPDEARALASAEIDRVAKSHAKQNDAEWERAAREAELDRLERGAVPKPKTEYQQQVDEVMERARLREDEGAVPIVDRVANDVISKIHEAIPESKPQPKTPEAVRAEAAPAPVAHPPAGTSQVDWSRMTLDEVRTKAEEAGAKLDPTLRKVLDEGGDIRAVTTLEQRKSAQFRDEVGQYTGLQSRVHAAERIAERNGALDARARGNVESAAKALGVEPPPAKSMVEESAKIAERIKQPEPPIAQPKPAEVEAATEAILKERTVEQTVAEDNARAKVESAADRRIRQEIEEHAIDMEIEKRRANSTTGQAETLEVARLKHREAIVREKNRRKLEGKKVEDMAPEGVDPKVWRSNVAQAIQVKYIFDKFGYWDERMINNLRRFYGAERTAKMMGLTGAELDEAANLARELGGQGNIKGMKQTPMHAELTDLDAQASAARSRDERGSFNRLDNQLTRRTNHLLRDPEGFMRTEAMIAASGALVGGAAGAAMGGESLEEKAAGAVAGVVLGLIAADIGTATLGGKRMTMSKAGEMVSELDTANLLAGPAIVKASWGSIGGITAGAAEKMLVGQHRMAGAGLKYMVTGGVRDYIKVLTANSRDLKALSGRTGYSGQGSGYHAPSGTVTSKVLEQVTRPFVAADYVGMKALKKMGYTEGEAKRYMANGTPTTSVGQQALSLANSQWWLRMLVKFPKVRIGGLERMVEYTPGLHKLGARGAHGAEQITRRMANAKAIYGGAAMAAGTAYGYFRDPGNVETGFAASVSGPAFVPVTAAIMAGKALRKSSVPKAAGAYVSELFDNVPRVDEGTYRTLPHRLKPLRPFVRGILGNEEY